MSRPWIASALVVAGCGRVAFEARDDAASDGALLGHDEDGDGLPDGVDPCPFLAGDTADADGDGVGDACDPSNTSAERIRVFETMTGPNTCNPYVSNGPGWSESGDEWIVRGATITALQCLNIPITDAEVWLGVDIETVQPTTPLQISVALLRSDTSEYFYSDLYSEGSPGVSLNFYDGVSSFSPLDFQAIPAIHTGAYQVRFRARLTGGPLLTTTSGWPGETYTAQAAAPGYIGGEWLQFFSQNLDLRYRYFAVIAP